MACGLSSNTLHIRGQGYHVTRVSLLVRPHVFSTYKNGATALHSTNFVLPRDIFMHHRLKAARNPGRKPSGRRSTPPSTHTTALRYIRLGIPTAGRLRAGNLASQETFGRDARPEIFGELVVRYECRSGTKSCFFSQRLLLDTTREPTTMA
ncbi:hypothetical protein BDW59DRAFT_17504 [Aspergillus cavernicola]|uniref:Uncharacterized protein n=1 Tax=Aspergillus cavernicola TaxID=176166 RepID=A0ABR4HHU5_9EURO